MATIKKNKKIKDGVVQVTDDMVEFRKKLSGMGQLLHEKFKNMSKAIGNFANAAGTLKESLQKTSIQITKVHVTNYNCICGSKLIITGHNNMEIFYECLDCGRSYKAKKNKILGRFR